MWREGIGGSIWSQKWYKSLGSLWLLCDKCRREGQGWNYGDLVEEKEFWCFEHPELLLMNVEGSVIFGKSTGLDNGRLWIIRENRNQKSLLVALDQLDGCYSQSWSYNTLSRFSWRVRRINSSASVSRFEILICVEARVLEERREGRLTNLLIISIYIGND